jgi:hypothetical protein
LPGDLVFFGKSKITHVGLYLGEENFIHSGVENNKPKITISAMDELNDEKRSEFDALEGAIKTLDSDIKRAEAQEDLNKTIIAAQTSAKIVDEERNIDIGTQFRDFLTKAIEKDGSKRFNLRAITTSTDTNIINKSSKSIDYKLSDGYKLYKQ